MGVQPPAVGKPRPRLGRATQSPLLVTTGGVGIALSEPSRQSSGEADQWKMNNHGDLSYKIKRLRTLNANVTGVPKVNATASDFFFMLSPGACTVFLPLSPRGKPRGIMLGCCDFDAATSWTDDCPGAIPASTLGADRDDAGAFESGLDLVDWLVKFARRNHSFVLLDLSRNVVPLYQHSVSAKEVRV